MKSAFLLFALLSLPSAVFAQEWSFTSPYRLVGECGPFVVSRELAVVTFVSETPIESAGVGQGATDDGAEGCGNFKAMMECPSQTGRFEVESVDGPIFHLGPNVLKFECL